MKTIGLTLLLIFSVTPCWAESESNKEQPEPEKAQAQEPNLYDHYLALQQMQQTLASRSLDDQARLQPQVRRAELRACQKLRKEREERVSNDDYRRQGGDQFVAFTEQFERYCETLQ